MHFGYRTFEYCFSLKVNITITQGLQRIDSNYFDGCTLLQSVLFDPMTDVQLGSNIFYGCKELQSVILPQNLLRIPKYCFLGCTLLEMIQIPESIRKIEEFAFYGSVIQNIVLLENVRSIVCAAFAICLSLERVTICSSLILQIEENTFMNFPSIFVIDLYQWLGHKIFESMKNGPSFLFKFFKQYHNHVFDCVKHRGFDTPPI